MALDEPNPTENISKHIKDHKFQEVKRELAFNSKLQKEGYDFNEQAKDIEKLKLPGVEVKKTKDVVTEIDYYHKAPDWDPLNLLKESRKEVLWRKPADTTQKNVDTHTTATHLNAKFDTLRQLKDGND